MVARIENQTNTKNLNSAVETRREGQETTAPAHGTEWPGCRELHPWHARYHEGLPSRMSHSQQRHGVSGTPQCLQRPGRGRR
jgi:hypothetical protein